MAKSKKVEEVKEEKVETIEKVEEVKDEEYEELTLEDRVINIEKKTNTILIIVVIAAILALLNLVFIANDGESSASTTDSGTQNEETSAEYDLSQFEEISAGDIASLSKNETIVIYIGRESCGYCVQYIPVLQEVQASYNYTTKYINIAKIIDYNTGSISDQDAYDTLINMNATEDQKDTMNDFGSTPMTLIVKNNKITGSIVGYVDSATLETLITDAGFSK